MCVSAKHQGIGDEEEMWVGTLWAIRGWYRDFLTPLQVDTFTFNVDSDHAGCLRTLRSTTGITAGGVIMAASTTEMVFALSS